MTHPRTPHMIQGVPYPPARLGKSVRLTCTCKWFADILPDRAEADPWVGVTRTWLEHRRSVGLSSESARAGVSGAVFNGSIGARAAG